ncbi:MAG: hypothetical protein ACOY4Q_11635 [Bacillota bacterium]
MLSDKTIWELLGDTEQDIGPDFLRLLMIEMFSRIRRLEQVNFALQAIILQQGIADEEFYRHILKEARQYMDRQDEAKAAEADIWKKSGLGFAEMVNFTLRGSFARDTVAPDTEPTGAG